MRLPRNNASSPSELLSKFVLRTFLMVTDSSYPQIDWNDSGTSFRVHDDYQSVLRHFFPFFPEVGFFQFLRIFQFDQRSDIHHREFTHPYFQRNREDLLPLLVGEVLARQPQGFTSPRVAQVGKILHLCRRLTDTERQLGTLQAELKDTRKILDTIQPAPAAGKVDYSLPPLRTLLKDVKWESSD